MRPSRRALLGGLSVLLPAAGIAYLGAVSYQDDRGAVADQIDEQFRAAERVADAVERELARSLDAIDEVFVAADGRPGPDRLERLAERAPLAEHPFLISRTGRVVFPAQAPLRAVGPQPAPDRLLAPQSRTCPERGLVACVRAMRSARRRQAQLAEAHRLELGSCAGGGVECRVDARAVGEARRRYQGLVRHDDTGPDALLGLARLDRAAGDTAAAAARFRELGERFGRAYDDDGVPFGLIAAVGAAEVMEDGASLLAVFRDLIARRYRAPSAVLDVVAERLRARLGEIELTGEQREQLAELDRRFALARSEVRFADRLAGDVDDLIRLAEPQVRGRPARGTGGTLIFRRLPDGAIIGALVERDALAEVAADADVDLHRLAEGARTTLRAVGEVRPRASRERTLASAGFGQTLPHLTLDLVNDRSAPDPLDEIVRDRGRRHLAITGGLVAILVVGLIATIRGAARERELARLKSEFVATVSHELKTPLTSIRMFAEMLQQDVAGSDRDRERRYHKIIVNESERLGLLISNLLDYSQIEKGTRRYQRERQPAGEILDEAVATFERLREEARPAVVVDADADAAIAEIQVDRDVVVQALLNLLANAAKYGGTDHPIEARVAIAGDRIALSVADQGPGIPKAEQSRIFKEFYRTPAAYSSQVEGTGLGLALVKRHVEAQGGEVTVDSAVGRGATFTLSFPRAEQT